MQNILSRLFAAEPRSWEHLRGIRELQWIEGAADALHGCKIGFTEHLGHHVLFVLPDAVFSGDGTARGQTEFENFIGERFRGFLLPLDMAIVENEWMEIAIAGMKDVGDAKTGFAAETRNLAHYLRQSRSRYHTVLDDVVRRDAAHGSEGGFASLPHQGALGFALRQPNFQSTILAAEFINVAHKRLDLHIRAIEFYEKQAATIGIVGVNGGFGSLDGKVVHHFDGRGQHASSDDVADGRSGFVGAWKRSQQCADALRSFHDTKNNFRGDAESAFGPDKQASQIVPGRVESLSSDVHQGTVWKDDIQAENVSRRESILEAVRSTGILGNVAANAAYRLRGWIGCVEIAVRFDAAGNVKIENARFNDNALVGKIDLEDAIHTRKADDNSLLNGQRTATQPGARTSRDEGDTFRMTKVDN